MSTLCLTKKIEFGISKPDLVNIFMQFMKTRTKIKLVHEFFEMMSLKIQVTQKMYVENGLFCSTKTKNNFGLNLNWLVVVRLPEMEKIRTNTRDHQYQQQDETRNIIEPS